MQTPRLRVNQAHFPPKGRVTFHSWEQGKAGCMLKNATHANHLWIRHHRHFVYGSNVHSGPLHSGMVHISTGTDRPVVWCVGFGLKAICQKTGSAAIMKINFRFALLAYYTWWLIVLVCLVIILYKLLTNQNFSKDSELEFKVCPDKIETPMCLNQC